MPVKERKNVHMCEGASAHARALALVRLLLCVCVRILLHDFKMSVLRPGFGHFENRGA